MTDISVNELREWAKTCMVSMTVPPQAYDSETQLAADILRLIVAYRDMAIEAGRWPCKCGEAHIGNDHDEIFEPHGCRYDDCSCVTYRPVEL